MGMTIDESLSDLEGLKVHCGNMAYSDSLCNVWNQDVRALTVAIDTMRKYQKIEHIVKAEIPYKLVEIEKVIEDGKID